MKFREISIKIVVEFKEYERKLQGGFKGIPMEIREI